MNEAEQRADEVKILALLQQYEEPSSEPVQAAPIEFLALRKGTLRLYVAGGGGSTGGGTGGTSGKGGATGSGGSATGTGGSGTGAGGSAAHEGGVQACNCDAAEAPAPGGLALLLMAFAAAGLRRREGSRAGRGRRQ